MDSRDRVPVRERNLCRRDPELARAEAHAAPGCARAANLVETLATRQSQVASCLRQSKRQELAGVPGTADGHDDVLTTAEHIGHRRAALRRGHVDGADRLASRLVI